MAEANSCDSRFDVIVSGAGMAGAAFAALLAISEKGRSLSIAVVEANTFIPRDLAEGFDPRVVALTSESQQLLDSIGVWQQIATTRVCPYSRMHVWDAEGTGAIDFDAAEVRQPCLGHIVENSIIVEALLQRIDGLANVRLLCPEKVTAVNRLPGGAVEVVLDSGAAISSQLLVAADGARSKVRELCGLALREWDYGHHAIITTVKTEREHGATARQRFLSEGPLAFLPLRTTAGDDHYCSIVWSQQVEVAEAMMALDDKDFCAALERAGESCLGKVLAVDKRFKVPLRQRHAVDYVLPGIALVGDAAHTIHPLAGQGINLGFQDVTALVEELQRARNRGVGLGDPLVLGRYQRRRKPRNLGMMAVMEGFKRLFEEQSLPVRLLRNDGMSAVNRLGPIKNLIVRQAMGLD